MKKLFGRDKPKPTKQGSNQEPISTPIHALYAQDSPRESDKWEIVTPHDQHDILTPHNTSASHLPPGASPPTPRSASPFGKPQPQQPGMLQKKAKQGTAALGILRALDPHEPLNPVQDRQRSKSEDRDHDVPPPPPSAQPIVKETNKKPFWERHSDKPKIDRRDDDSQEELTRMIGFLTATASEDWALVLEVCDRASATQDHAKEAVRALRREFKYGEPSAQLSAARLWAIMLRNSSELFITQCTTRKFLDTIEDVLTSPRTSPVVKDRVMDVVAAAAYASGSKKDTGFRGLWRRVKPPGKPDEGMPFDTDDSIFNPPNNRLSQVIPVNEPPPHAALQPLPPPNSKPHKKKHIHNRIIPPEEDIRRLFQECKIGQGNASLLAQALVIAQPEDLDKRGVIKEFYAKCRSSQELICAQIDWATAGAERSRAEQRVRTISDASLGTNGTVEETVEEQLLAALLAANEELLEALAQYDDLERVLIERQAEDRSRKEVKMDRRLLELQEQLNLSESHPSGAGARPGGSRPVSRSPSPQHRIPRSRPVSASFPNYSDPSNVGGGAGQMLALPPAAPVGPRSPAALSIHSSRTPSPGKDKDRDRDRDRGREWDHPPQPHHHPHHHHHQTPSAQTHGTMVSTNDYYSDSESDLRTPIHPSAKALGKRRASPPPGDDPAIPPSPQNSDEFESPVYSSESSDSDEEDRDRNPYQLPAHASKPVFVYDAAAERTAERLREGQVMLVNGVH